MSSESERQFELLHRFCKAQISQAGQRYTPGVDPSAPNLPIAALSSAIDNIACSQSALKRFRSVLDEFNEHWSRAKHNSQRIEKIEKLISVAEALSSIIIDRFLSRDASVTDEWISLLTQFNDSLVEDIKYWNAEEAKLPPHDGGYSPAHNNIRSNLDEFSRCLRVIREEIEYTSSPSFKVLYEPFLLIAGEWGTGKTHLLCDATEERLARKAPTVLVLAKNFKGAILAEIFTSLGGPIEVQSKFTELNRAGMAASERIIIFVDGVNEGERRDWRKAMTTLISMVGRHSNVGLVVTCRTPFETIAFQESDLKKLHRLQHFGFDNQEFDAQAAFFQYYQLPLPEVPLLDREFSRPLTLKLICQSLKSLSSEKVSKGFSGIASGQRGMTYVLESFVNRVGKPIISEFGLKQKGCWLLLKGDDKFPDHRVAGFAPCMAANLRGYVLPSEADRVIAVSYPGLGPAGRRRLLEAMRVNGLIEEDAIWYTTRKKKQKSRIVYRLPYQRFSDHLIARHLLGAYLDTSSASSIKNSFAVNSPLGKVFGLTHKNFGNYDEPGWAQALIAEFPERVGKKLPASERELFFSLPKEAQDLNAYFEPFVDGLFWRSPTSFTAGTREVINIYLRTSSYFWERVVDALVALATKPKHPYQSRRLYQFLSRYQMADRDLRWSEYLRKRYASPSIHRLMNWAEKLDRVITSRDVAAELITLFSLVLTTVVRSDRDLATKALVLLGEKHPEVLFEHVFVALDFNDPYVPERMLAAAYGVSLSLVDSEHAGCFRPRLGDLAKRLYRRMFAPHARNATHHTHMRDYALGIIEVANSVGCVKLPKTSAHHLSRPFRNTPSTFASDGTPSNEVNDTIDHAIQMDFGNYTIGRLIPDRANYDETHPEYVRVRAKIERRIFDLGYRAQRFKHADSEIGRNSWNSPNGHKVDRYGKKYSWIAYFEMWGERDANRKLPDWRQDCRTSECGIDPTFPKVPPSWPPPLPDLLGPPAPTTEEWVTGGFTPNWHQLLLVPEINGYKGEWVLIEGFVQGVDSSHDRELFAFLRGLFVAKKDVNTVKEKFLSTDYPGNNKIPDGAEEHYLFAGEPGHRESFARHLLKTNGQYRRQIAEAFDEYVSDYSKAERVSISINIVPMSKVEDGSGETRVLKYRVPTTRRIPGVKVEIPYIRFSWESYHSVQNIFSGFKIPAPSLIQRLQLKCRNREMDFFDNKGQPGTLYREEGGNYSGNILRLLYIRADLLRKYLKETRQVLVWCNWGERDWLKKIDGQDLLHTESRRRVFQAHSHIHRTFSQWSSKDGGIL